MLVSTDQMEIPYSFVSEFEISGKVDEAWMMAVTWIGQRLVTAALTGALEASRLSNRPCSARPLST